MDLNELLHVHQVEVMKAKALGKGEARESHFQNVADYTKRVRALRKVSPADTTAASPASRETIIFGTYAGNGAEAAASAAGDADRSVDTWELSENPDRGQFDV